MHRKLIPWLVGTVASYAGWMVGAHWGTGTGFFVSIVAAAVGIYYGRVWVTENL